VSDTEELVIDESNFAKYFFDVRTHQPQAGQIVACYTATAEFGPGPDKKNIVHILQKTDKATVIPSIMRKVLNTSQRDAVRVPLEMAKDLSEGLSAELVEDKPYKYTFEMYFYTKPEYIPKGDPHWTTISLLNVDKFTENSKSEWKTNV